MMPPGTPRHNGAASGSEPVRARGPRVEQLRRQHGLSQDDLASRIGAGRTTVEDVEAGKPVSRATLEAAAEVLGVTADDILAAPTVTDAAGLTGEADAPAGEGRGSEAARPKPPAAVELHVDRPFDRWGQEEEAGLLRALSDAAGLSGDVRATARRAAGVLLTLELGPEDAERLTALQQRGDLAALKVQAARRLPDVPAPPAAGSRGQADQPASPAARPDDWRVKLVVVRGRPQGRSFLLRPGEYVFGRGAECFLRPNSDWVSRQHCQLKVGAGGQASVRDLGSRNGTLVNGARIRTEAPLKHGDQIQVGPLVFEVRFEEGGPADAAQTTPPPPIDPGSGVNLGGFGPSDSPSTADGSDFPLLPPRSGG